MSAKKSLSKPLIPHMVNGRFYFDKQHKPESLLFGTLPSSFLSFVYSMMKKKVSVIHEDWVVQRTPLVRSVAPIITWIGHATFLIQLNGVNILVDPIWGMPSYFHPRTLPPGVALHELPNIDGILLSHNHRDHMDEKTLLHIYQKNNNKVIFGVPLGDKKWFLKRGITNVYECMWEDTVVIGSGDDRVTVTFVPGHHWSQRHIFDKNHSLWGGWVIQSGSTTIYFAGDTAYSVPCFERIAYLFPHIDCALLPIGPGEPRKWMKHTHLDAHEAGDAFLLLGANSLVPMHWGTYTFGYDNFDDPVKKLLQWWQDNNQFLHAKRLCIPKIGEQYEVIKDHTHGL